MNDDHHCEFREKLAESIGRELMLRQVLRGMLDEWDRLSRYGSPMAKAATMHRLERRRSRFSRERADASTVRRRRLAVVKRWVRA